MQSLTVDRHAARQVRLGCGNDGRRILKEPRRAAVLGGPVNKFTTGRCAEVASALRTVIGMVVA